MQRCTHPLPGPLKDFRRSDVEWMDPRRALECGRCFKALSAWLDQAGACGGLRCFLIMIYGCS